jgi:quinoprotein glucose dehydrogenase
VVEDSTSWLQDFIDNPEGEPQTIREQLSKVETGEPFIPISLKGTIMFPGFDGGAEWGGAAYDPTEGILYVNSNEMPWIYSLNKLETSAITSVLEAGEQLYGQQCARCHGAELQGEGSIPALRDLRLTSEQISQVISQGQGVMPAFNHLSSQQIEAIDAFLRQDQNVEIPLDSLNIDDPASSPYGMRNFGRFLTKEGYPAVSPPWGTLNAIDLSAGEIKWQVPLGEFEELTAKGIPKTGTENYGGPVVTAGDLIFIASTKDERIRAFNKNTGEELWQDKLPYGGYATPSTYEIDGRQYLVIACGGGKMGTPSGDVYRAYALGR